jgi:NADH dehydrogenase FAD-containing subunit
MPVESHYYQPMFTLIGGGLRSLQDATQPEAAVLPQGVDWLRTAVAEIDADSSSITTADGKKLKYEYLVVATGEPLCQKRYSVHRDGVDAMAYMGNMMMMSVHRVLHCMR